MANPHQFGRVIYIEPNNDIDGTGKGTNFTHNPEDYSILVDLQVDVVDRFAYNGSGSKEAIEYTLEWDAKGTKTSMFKGTNGMLTTRAMDTAFNDIINDYNQEAIGINSIEIRYNSWNYPEITIQFTDIRGATLLSSADYVHTSLAGNENKAKYADNFANTFFSTFFRFPYPRYTLIVKGFYGRPVSYTLCVSDFKTKFNSSTGNFDVTVSFIGYMYGILTDIPMRLLFAAPHSEYKGKKYWEDNRDKTKKFVYANSNQTPMKRFTELSDEIKAIKDKLSELPEVKKATDEAKAVETRKAELDSVKDAYEAFKGQYTDPKRTNITMIEKSMSTVSADDGTENIGHKYLILFKGGNEESFCKTCNGTGHVGEHTVVIGGGIAGYATSAQVQEKCPDCDGKGKIDNDVEEFDIMPSLKESLFNAIRKYNDKPENAGRSITYIPRIETPENVKLQLRGSKLYSKIGKKFISPTVLIGDEIKEKIAFVDVEKQDLDEICDYLNNDCMGIVESLKSEAVGVCILKVDAFEHSMNTQLFEIESELERAFDKVKDTENKVYENLLGFKVNIRNIIDMCLAHLDTFMHCMYTCMDDIKEKNRLFSECNLSTYESDVKTTVVRDTDNKYKVYLPPFFAFRKENPKTKELEDAWIGDDRRFADEGRFVEIQLINGFLNGMLQNEMDRKERAKEAIEGKSADEYGLVVGENYHPMFVNDYYQKINPYDKVDLETYEPLIAMFAFRCLLGLVYSADYPNVNSRYNTTDSNKNKYFELLGAADAKNFSISRNFKSFKESELSHGSFNNVTWEDFRAYILGLGNNKIISSEKQHMFFAGDNNALFKTITIKGTPGFAVSYGRGDKIAVPLNFESPETAVDIASRIASGENETNGFGVSRQVAMPVVSINESDKEFCIDSPVIGELFNSSGIENVDNIGFYFKSNEVWSRYVSGTSSKFWTWDPSDVFNKLDPDYWFPSVVLSEDVKNIETAEKRSDNNTYRGNLYNSENIGEGKTVYAYEPMEDLTTSKSFFLDRPRNIIERVFGNNNKGSKVSKNTTKDTYIDEKVVPLMVDGETPGSFMLLGFPCGEGTLFEHEFFLQQTNRLVKAFLFLHSLPSSEVSAIGEVVSSIMKKTYTPSITDIPFVSALFIGALYWRESNDGLIEYGNYKRAGTRDLITHGINRNGNKITRPLNPTKDDSVTYITTYDPQLEQKIKELEKAGATSRYDKKLNDYLNGDEKKNALFCGFWDVDDTVKQRFIDLFTNWANGDEFGYFLDEFSCGLDKDGVEQMRWIIDNDIFKGRGLKCEAQKTVKGVKPNTTIIAGTSYNTFIGNTFPRKFFKNHMKMGASNKDISLITALRPNADAVVKLSSLLSRGCVVKVAFPRALMTRDVFGTGWTDEVNSVVVSENIMKSAWQAFHEGIMAAVGEKEEDDEADDAKVRNITPPSVTSEEKLSLYLTLKNVHDKWLIATKREKYMFSNGPEENTGGHRSISDNFYFINSYYEDVGEEINLNIEELPKQLDRVLTDINGASSLYSFMYDVADQARMQLLALPVFNKMSDQDYVKSIFTPMPYDEINVTELDTETEYVFMYPEEASKHLDLPSDSRNEEDRYKFEDDSFTFVTESGVENIGDTPNTFFNTEERNVPVFGVTFAKQNQSIFKDINISMDSPKTTEVAIYNTVAIADRYNAGNTQITALGQDLFPIYSNYSYECSITMMGCACIMPLMYFQLNNIPMFKGSYIIYNVTHTITPGNMTTTFSGQRLSKFRKKRNENALAGFPNENGNITIQKSIEEAVNKLTDKCYTISGHKLENEYVYSKMSEICGITNKSVLRAVEYAESHYTGGFFSDGKLKVYYDPWMAKSSGVTYSNITDTQFGTSYVGHADYDGNINDINRANEQLTVPSSTTIVGAFGLPSQLYQQYGVSSMQTFFDNCAGSFANQGAYFATLLKNNSELKNALESENWALFAKLYKGSGGVTASGVYMPGDNSTFDNYAHDLETGYNEASGACSDYEERYEGPTGVYEPASKQFGIPEVTEVDPNARTLDVQKAVNYALAHAHASSTGKCATYVKNALAAGGIPYVSCNASDCKQEAFIRDDCYKLYDSKPGEYGVRGNSMNDKMERGDIVIIDSFNSHKYGHIAIWTGKNWVSDFKQNNCDIYKDGKQAWDAGKFHFYRFKNRINV